MKRILSFALAMVLVFSLFPVNASADTNDIGLRLLDDGEEYTVMTTSQSMIDMIKDMEGFRSTPYADHTQWSIGYGSYCGSISSPKPDLVISEAEAEQMLREDLEEVYEDTVNDFCESIGRQPTQQQFDALLDFTYNLGGSWTWTNCRLRRWLKDPTTEMELVNAMAVWGRVDGDLNYTIIMRRIREAIVFMKGEYYLSFGSGDFETELTVVANEDLPYYNAVIYRGNGGKNYEPKHDEVIVYHTNEEYGSLASFTRDGYSLVGWEITKISNSPVSDGDYLSIRDIAEHNIEVTAVWTEGYVEPTEPEPEPTDPEPTDPEPTDPEPTEPEPTQPEEEDTLPFTDVPQDAWYRDAVEFVYENGYMNGTASDKFSPGVITNRSMLVTVLYRIDGSPAVTDEQRSCFSDIQGQYYTDAVAWAYANGIVNGTGDGKFKPLDYITRQDAITMFYRYCKEYLMLDSPAQVGLETYVDAGSVSGYANDAMSWAVANGLVKGVSTSSGMCLNPRANLSRAEAATLLMRLVEQIMGSI